MYNLNISKLTEQAFLSFRKAHVLDYNSWNYTGIESTQGAIKEDIMCLGSTNGLS